MESSKDLIAVSSASEALIDSPLSAALYDISQKVQEGMENILKMMSEIDQNSCGIEEEIEKCKESAFERKKNLEDDKERFQKAAYTMLEMLNNGEDG